MPPHSAYVGNGRAMRAAHPPLLSDQVLPGSPSQHLPDLLSHIFSDLAALWLLSEKAELTPWLKNTQVTSAHDP